MKSEDIDFCRFCGIYFNPKFMVVPGHNLFIKELNCSACKMRSDYIYDIELGEVVKVRNVYE